VGESQRLLERNWADVMLAGGVSSRLNPYDLLRDAIAGEMSPCNDPQQACRPFDADRDGQVRGEGATILVLERADYAAKRGAAPLAVLRSTASAFEPVAAGGEPSGAAVRAAVTKALSEAGLSPSDVGFVSAHGLATRAGDRGEAAALRAVVPNRPIFAPKGYVGNLGSGCGALEAALAVLSLSRGRVPPTLHCDRPDAELGLNIVREPLANFPPTCVVVNYTARGQAVAAVLSAP
jgi:3-oxoacyl-(acyl-carrier-protein) synthase